MTYALGVVVLLGLAYAALHVAAKPRKRRYVLQLVWLGSGGMIGDLREGLDFFLSRRVKRRYYVTPRRGEVVCLDDRGTTVLPILSLTHENDGTPVLFLGHLSEDSENAQPLFESLVHWGYKRDSGPRKRGQATTVEARRPALQATTWAEGPAEVAHLRPKPERHVESTQQIPAPGLADTQGVPSLSGGADLASGVPRVEGGDKQPA